VYYTFTLLNIIKFHLTINHIYDYKCIYFYYFLIFSKVNEIYLYIDYIIIINMKSLIIGQIQKVKFINRVNFINTQ